MCSVPTKCSQHSPLDSWSLSWWWLLDHPTNSNILYWTKRNVMIIVFNTLIDNSFDWLVLATVAVIIQPPRMTLDHFAGMVNDVAFVVVVVFENNFSKRETDRITSEVEKFLNECLRDDASSVSKIFLYSTKRHWKTFCSKKRQQKKQQKLLQVSVCFNTIIDQVDCLELFANRTRDLIPYRIGMDKVNRICW